MGMDDHVLYVMEVFSATIPYASIDRNLSVRGQPWQNCIQKFAPPHPLISWKRHACGNRCSQVVLQSKKSLFQDFQGFAEPSRLLPVTEAKFCSGLKLDEILALSSSRMSNLYIIQFFTSIEFGSDLMDMNAAILLSLIDIEGNSVLQRISAALTEDLEINGILDSKDTRFRRGSVESIAFQGPEMGKVNALWVGLESGSWRLSNVRLLVIDLHESSGLNLDLKEFLYKGQMYEFEEDDLLLGEANGASMTELQPKSMIEIPIANASSLFYFSPSPFSGSTTEKMVSNQESMKGYMNLKLSLLVYDAILVSAGTATLSLLMSLKAAVAFLFGGISGFLYLLLLQKSVDGISASPLPLAEEESKNMTHGLGGSKGPLANIALLIAVCAAVVNYWLEKNEVEVTTLEFLIGVLGFFTCRIAVLFAAFKPLATDEKKIF